MAESTLVVVSSIVICGVMAEWIAWRLRLPSVLLLLILGFWIGPVIGFLDPDLLLGDLLLPIVSISVALILFEGGLSLRISELRQVGGVVRNLITLGALLTWWVVATAASMLLGLHLELAVLLGAILIPTGPTVIVPLLRHLRPTGATGPILKWEGIMIDPIGAMLAVLVFEIILSGGFRNIGSMAFTGLAATIGVGGLSGIFGAGLLIFLLKRYWIPDFLQNAVTLMIVVTVYMGANLILLILEISDCKNVQLDFSTLLQTPFPSSFPAQQQRCLRSLQRQQSPKHLKVHSSPKLPCGEFRGSQPLCGFSTGGDGPQILSPVPLQPAAPHHAQENAGRTNCTTTAC